MNYNLCTFVGRLVADPKLELGDGDKKASRCNYRIAINRINSEKYDVINCTSWGKLAEAAGQYLSKGKEVLVQGNWRTNFTKKEDGTYNNFQGLNVSFQQFGRDSLKKQQADAATGTGKKAPADELDALAEKLANAAKPKVSKLDQLVEKLMKRGIDKAKATELATAALAEDSAPAADETAPEAAPAAGAEDCPF